jgi:hypothetical protein
VLAGISRQAAVCNFSVVCCGAVRVSCGSDCMDIDALTCTAVHSLLQLQLPGKLPVAYGCSLVATPVVYRVELD